MIEMELIPCTGSISFCLTIILLASIGLCSSSAQTEKEPFAQMNYASAVKIADNSTGYGSTGYSGTGHDSDTCCQEDACSLASGADDGSADVLVQKWRGFAANDSASNSVRINVETIKAMDPGEARRLLASNMSLEEVRTLAREGERDKIFRGSMRLNNDSYRLMDITMASAGNGSAMNASIVLPRRGLASEGVSSVVGHVSMDMYDAGNPAAVKGYVVIDDSNYNGVYRLQLEQCSGRGPRAGWAGNGRQAGAASY